MASEENDIPAEERIRTGTVLMNSPAIDSIPSMAEGLPETTAPNTASSVAL
ncbi:hypothetical protein CHCC15337_4114 [Bacillus paralicheniformis]|nr:hypothetical protein CHCC4186_4263 [Bacillus paralicheniformis]TWL39478.1 hypothetical protein CHCC15337_4114 [Bacillus paralicheniformis]